MIEVKNRPTQSIELFSKALQEIEIENTPKQEIELVVQGELQSIDVENISKQEVEVLQGHVIKMYDNVEYYEGAYEVTPKVEAQTLPTADKLLNKDVTIEKIPYFEVGNNSGGMTASIGDEIARAILGTAVLGEVIL